MDRVVWRRLALIGFFALLAWVQLGPAVHHRPDGPWFLFGADTVSKDAITLLWMNDHLVESNGTMPLWMPPLKGGLPSIGAFLWTPFAPTMWTHPFVAFPLAQRAHFLWMIFWLGLGGYWLGRVLGLRRVAALLLGTGCGVGGHFVTLIYAGHMHKCLALAWLPWFAGGMLLALAPGATRTQATRGVAIAAGALGMALLNGHPQIAYTMLLILGLRVLFALASRQWFAPAIAIGVVAFGCLIGAGQLVPGLEMSALSNRGGEGMAFAESAETSYPPSEALEFILPRMAGDSSRVGYGRYAGKWGERLVSDYVGVFVFLLALMGLRQRERRREIAFWWLIAGGFLIIGFGRYTPIYEFLFRFFPGMTSFRSPGTYYCAVALALPILGAMGFDHFLTRIEDRDRIFRSIRMLGIGAITFALVYSLANFKVVALGHQVSATPDDLDLWRAFTFQTALMRSAGVLTFGFILLVGVAAARCLRTRLMLAFAVVAFVAGDQILANRAFLCAEDWAAYSRYLAPTALDVALADEQPPVRVLELGRELATQPILHGRDAILGYHPIGFRKFEEQLSDLGAGTPEWRNQWGINRIWFSAKPKGLPENFVVEAEFLTPPGGILVRDPGITSAVSIMSDDKFARTNWLEYRPDRQVLQIATNENATLRVSKTVAPGWRWRLESETVWHAVQDVALFQKLDIPPGGATIVWEYRPSSYRIGLFATGIGILLFLTTMVGTCVKPSECKESPASS